MDEPSVFIRRGSGLISGEQYELWELRTEKRLLYIAVLQIISTFCGIKSRAE